jgi:ABC-type uncharacterized transport system permease subunit
LVLFFSGMLLPLAIMPQWLRAIAGYLAISRRRSTCPSPMLSGLTPLG